VRTAPSSGESGANLEIGARPCGFIDAELKVRIHFPPAESHANFRFLEFWSAGETVTFVAQGDKEGFSSFSEQLTSASRPTDRRIGARATVFAAHL
jgi:hypothetical protein